MHKTVILNEGREKSLKNRHPWIFSGAISSMPDCEPGEILDVQDSTGQFLAKAYFNPGHSLAGRILTFEEKEIADVIKDRLIEAKNLRKTLFESSKTNAYRLINGEGDGIPGLIVDEYNGYLAIQIHTYGIERLKDQISDLLIEIIQPKGIYEKSLSPSRLDEGLEPREGHIYGEDVDQIEILENGIKFFVSIKLGQKTGFFLDQRQMRSKIQEMAEGRLVLNCFAYSGAFSLYALKGGAKKVVSVDTCDYACRLAESNTRLNHIPLEKHQIIREDVFDFLENRYLDSDFVILDPPAFAKKRKSLEMATKGYRRLNSLVFRKLPPRSYLLTCSCSYHMNQELFQKTIFQAARKSGRFVRVLSHHLQAPDHPFSLSHPEGSYLKSLLLFVE